MKICKGCRVEQAVIGGYCLACKHEMKSAFLREMAAGFAEADDEIRNADPHIYDDPRRMWTESGYDRASGKDHTAYGFWEELKRAGFHHSEDFIKQPPRKPPWPKPDIWWIPANFSYRVKDKVTEGWVDVPIEAVETKLGRKIPGEIRAKITFRQEIEECARRLLILLVYGCPPRIGPGKPPPKPKVDFNNSYGYYEDPAYMKYHKFTW